MGFILSHSMLKTKELKHTCAEKWHFCFPFFSTQVHLVITNCGVKLVLVFNVWCKEVFYEIVILAVIEERERKNQHEDPYIF